MEFKSLRTYLETRRTVPAKLMSEPGPNTSCLRHILTLASRTPDHGKLAPWRFLVIEKTERDAISKTCVDRLHEIAANEDKTVSEGDLEKTRTIFHFAPCLVALVSTAQIHPKIPVWEQQMAAAAAGMNLIHAANALYFSAQWLTGWMAYDERVCARLGLAANEKMVGFFHIGSASEGVGERARPNIDEHISYWKG